MSYAKFYSRPHNAVIRVYDEAGNVIEERTSIRAISKTGEVPALLYARSPLPGNLAESDFLVGAINN